MLNCTLGRNDQYPLENFKRGARVWIKDPDKVWTCGELVHDLTFACKSAEVRVGNEDNTRHYDMIANGLPFPCNPEILIGSNDLTSLSYLHEPAVLHSLRHRFVQRQAIYTYCGIVLVAINPYADCAHLYGDEVIQIYRNERDDIRKLDPHIYAIAEEAYVDLCEYGKNQSVIISGESGAGKTVSAKFVMRYLTSVASDCLSAQISGDHRRGQIENRVLASNPIMEAIGNAKTIRNDNSSRFGKFIQINFAEKQTGNSKRRVTNAVASPAVGALRVSGAEMKTYLLEKSRVVFRSANERNYHVFYQMCAAAESAQNIDVLDGLELLTASNYNYLCDAENSSFSRIEDVDDVQEFIGLLNAFNTLKISTADQREIFRILAGVLSLGNLRFEAADNGGAAACIRAADMTCVEHICDHLYNIDRDALTRWLTTREIRAGGDVVMKTLSVEEALANRDALAKVIYACLFDWIVERINENLSHMDFLDDGSNRNQMTRANSTDLPDAKFIGVLDIYGFETFERNSFEQFCINYANEKLQQQFNQHVFKLEQSEYEREKISWNVIDFDDNQLCINLIEGRPGIIDYLDEQCKTGRSTDEDWLDRMRNCKILMSTNRLQMPRIRNSSFVVRHFASDVAYHIDGFLEKNKDTVNEQLLNTIGKTKSAFLHEVVKDVLASSSTGVRRKRTVAIQFRDSLSRLITVLSATRPHYVRCIKPNDKMRSFHFDAKRTIQQLRANGVLETVRISAAGFPSRWTYEVFAFRYSLLLPLKIRRSIKPRDFARILCEKYLDSGKFALGETKIFLRTGQVACIERLRNERRFSAATCIQAFIKGFVCRRRFLRMRAAICRIQAILRAATIYRRVHYLRMYRAACCIQNFMWEVVRQRRRQRILTAILHIQAYCRGNTMRKQLANAKYLRAVILIQKMWRGYFVRRERIHYIRCVIKVQCCVRRFLARRELKHLKMEARSVNHLQNLNKGLENKIIALQQRLDFVTAKRNVTLQANEGLKSTCHKLQSVMRGAQCDLVAVKGILAETLRDHTVLKNEYLAYEKMLQLKVADIGERQAELIVENSRKDEVIADLKSTLLAKNEECQQSQEQLHLESTKVKVLERDLERTRAQLLENVALLASPACSRGGSFRSGYRAASSVDLKDADNHSTVSVEQAVSNDKLLIDQQQVINDLRRKLEEKERLNSRLKLHVGTKILNKMSDEISSNIMFESMKIQDLELTISKNRSDIQKLSDPAQLQVNFMGMLERSWDENERLRDEIRHIRAILAKTFERQTSVFQSSSVSMTFSPGSVLDSGCASGTGSDDGSHFGPTNGNSCAETEMEERIELERFLRHYRHLLDSASRELAERDDHILQLESQIHNDTETTITNESTSHENSFAPSHSISPVAMENLVRENLSLQRKYERKSDELAEARAYLRGYSTVLDSSTYTNFDEYGNDVGEDVQKLQSLKHDGGVSHSAMLEVFNVPEFIRILIHDMRPRIAKRHLPCLPAYLMLMAFRFCDQKSDEVGLMNLFNAANAKLRDNSMTSADTDVLALWLVNCWRLLNLLRQYSGDEANDNTDGNVSEWHAKNTPAQQLHAIRNFNLEPLRNQLKIRVQFFYNNLMKRTVEPLLTPKIVPAILQHESFDFRDENSAAADNFADGAKSRRSSLPDLMEFLNFVLSRLRSFGADTIIIAQVFRQISQWIVALALNHMMFRRDLCTPDKAISIKHNITQIQCWLMEKNVVANTAEMAPIFEPLIQASHLLMLRKSAAHLDVLCEETSCLRPKQVLAILRHFTPSADCRVEEDVIDESFLKMVAERLTERQTNQEHGAEKDELLMCGTYLEPFDTQPFLYSNVALETIKLPVTLNFESISRLV